MDKFDISIIEYLGKVDGGILVLIGILHNEVYYEATFFYNESDILLTISEEMELVTGPINQHINYKDILSDILKRIVPYSDMHDKIDPVNFSRWVEGEIEIGDQIVEEIDESEITNSK